MTYINNINRDEIRSGFLVTTDRKKVWNVEMELWAEFDRICRKHNLRYFVDFGTLLGAVRHKGFIPWDDDFDVSMLRPDYERFKEIAAKEISEPYFLQNSYTDIRITAFSKIMDLRTTAIEEPDLGPEDLKQGIFIDIFSMDPALDQTPKGNYIFEIQKELWGCVVSPDEVRRGIREHLDLAISSSLLEKLLELPRLERMREFEKFCLNHFEDTANLGFFTSVMQFPERSRKREWFSDVVYLPFESVEVPVPAGYDDLLKQEYGNYHEFVRGGSSHEGIIFSADISYREYLEKVRPLE